MKFTFHLFKSSVNSFEEAIQEGKLEGNYPFIPIAFRDQQEFDGRAYVQLNRPTRPRWMEYFNPFLEFENFQIQNQNNSLLLLINVSNRFFAITVGYGASAINRSQLELDFGLRVALNTIDSEKLLSVDARNIDTATKQKRQTINRSAPLSEFGFEEHEDLLRLVAGRPTNEDFAKRMVGKDSFSFTADVNFPDLGAKCTELIGHFESEVYKQHFGFIDHLRQVRNEAMLEKLNAALKTAINERVTDRLMLACPEMDAWLTQDEQSYVIKAKRRSKTVDEIDIGEVYEFLDEHQWQDIEPKHIRIIGVDGNGTQCTSEYTLDEWVVWECEIENETYVLSLSKWFSVATDYRDEISQKVAALIDISAEDLLPNWKKGDWEGTYNIAAAAERGYALLDKQNFMVQSYSRIEVADLLTEDRKFICVKKLNDSQTLSHLFGQGVVSATLLKEMRDYREFIQEQCPDNWENVIQLDNPDWNSYCYVYAIGTDKPQPLVECLPFFSKVNLINHVKILKTILSVDYALYKINMVD